MYLDAEWHGRAMCAEGDMLRTPLGLDSLACAIVATSPRSYTAMAHRHDVFTAS